MLTGSVPGQGPAPPGPVVPSSLCQGECCGPCLASFPLTLSLVSWPGRSV